MDTKGRVAIPASIREQLGEIAKQPFFLTSTPTCLEMLTEDAFERVLSALDRFPDMHPKVAKIQAFYVSPAQKVTIDTAGRVLVPPALREDAGLGSEVIVNGGTDRVQLYRPDVWDTERAKMHAEWEDLWDVVSEPRD
ncbi:hypothetical protein K8I61_17815 [bacterium]|nr:hypothetical protein [bacterium]